MDNTKRSNTQLLESKRRKRKNAVQKKLLKDIMAKKFPNLTLDINLKIQEAQQTPNRKTQRNLCPYTS